MRIGIIGAGMAGLSCAQALRHQGHNVIVFDKGRGPGGRMSTRRIDTPLGEAAFDHGAQYLTTRDRAFVAQVDQWAQDGHVARWSPAGPNAWVGTPAMNVPIRAMASDCDVRWNTAIDTLSHDDEWRIGDERFDAAIVAVPAEQVAYPLRITLDGKQIWSGATDRQLGYANVSFRPATGSVLRLIPTAPTEDRDAFGKIVELGTTKQSGDTGAETVAPGWRLAIVEADFHGPVAL